jgi:hypothetical protein
MDPWLRGLLMGKHTILLLAANPIGTNRDALDHEARAIHVELKLRRYPERCDLVTRWRGGGPIWSRSQRAEADRRTLHR